MPQQAITLELDELDAEHVEQVCFAAGAVSVVLTDCRDDAILEPAPGEVRLWPATRLQALFTEPLTATDVATLALQIEGRRALREVCERSGPLAIQRLLRRADGARDGDRSLRRRALT